MTTLDATLYDRFAWWLAAIEARDLAVLEDTIHPDWIYTDYTGHVHDRDEYFEIVRTLIQDGHETELLELRAQRLADDLALATGRYTSRGVLANGRRNEQDSVFTAVWRRDGDRWRCLAHQATNIGDAVMEM